MWCCVIHHRVVFLVDFVLLGSLPSQFSVLCVHTVPLFAVSIHSLPLSIQKCYRSLIQIETLSVLSCYLRLAGSILRVIICPVNSLTSHTLTHTYTHIHTHTHNHTYIPTHTNTHHIHTNSYTHKMYIHINCYYRLPVCVFAYSAPVSY